MPNENSEVDAFLQNLKGDDTNPFENVEIKKEEKKEEVGEEDKKIPFNEDPKIKRFIDKEISKRIGEIRPTEIIREVEGKETSELKDILTRIIGNDTPEKVAAVKDFEIALGKLEEKGAERALQQLQNEKEEEMQAEIDAQQELSNGFSDIEEQFNIDLTSSKPSAKALRSDFVDFITEVSPKDEEGNVVNFPDLQNTFKIFQERRKPESNNKAKELSSRSMTRSGDSSVTPQPKDNSWGSVDRIFGKFFS